MKSYRSRYRVLWVDDDIDASEIISTGQQYELDIQQYRNWERARTALDNRFDTYSAIILGGECAINAGEAPSTDFLYLAVREMEALFAQHEDEIPWFILSSGNQPDFELTVRRVGMGARAAKESEWGRLYYRKGSDLTDLCIAIKHAAANRKDIKIRAMYRDVFNTMNVYFPPDSRRTMLDILRALHFPEDNRKFDPVLYYTQLRRILEHLFRAANRIGVLPDEVMGERDKVNLSNSSLYLAGREVYLGQGRPIRFGQPGESVFPPITAQIVKILLVVANKNSHTVELDNLSKTTINDYYNSLQSNNLLFGYALHLCDVITWFGKYAQTKTARTQHAKAAKQHKDNNGNRNRRKA